MILLFGFLISITLILLAIYTLIGPNLWDRIQGVNLICSMIILAILVFSFGEQYYLDIALAFTLLSFIGTQFLAMFISRRGKL